jgi:dTDP-4-dehydrorhamnose reductase
VPINGIRGSLFGPGQWPRWDFRGLTIRATKQDFDCKQYGKWILMRIALIGARGQLATDLRPVLGDDIVALGHEDIEITQAEQVESALSQAGPNCVINTAAYNLVDRAEDEPEAAYRINALGARNLALYCRDHDIPLLHVSTDYVFSGYDCASPSSARRSVPYKETDAPSPQSAYAVSKLAGEYFVRSLCPRHFIVRTCGLYGLAGARGKGNFVETMLRLAGERDELRIVDDQCCTPSATADVARAIAGLIPTDAYGLYHATNSGSTTWYLLAREIFRLTGRDIAVQPVTSEEFGAKARRPAYSVLDNSKLEATIGFALPDWRDALAHFLNVRTHVHTAESPVDD